MNLKQRLKEGVPTRALYATAYRGYYAGKRLIAFLAVRSPRQLAKYFLARLQNRLFDWRNGVVTHPLIEPDRLRMESKTSQLANRYQGVNERLFLSILERHYQAEWQRYLFIDLGAGLGKALILASRFPFRALWGVEYSPLLCDQAVSNLQTFQKRHADFPPWRIIHQNAALFPFPDEPLLLFLYNPFHGEVFRDMITNLTDRLNRCAEPVFLLYIQPDNAQLIPEEHFRRVDGSSVWILYEGLASRASP
ncbi:MAG: class I SAM-dependent methyltransferase [Magnetococcales bacterium]|nr:class I SAM-dependent methyltransferase [Magnetococcales bacterium]